MKNLISILILLFSVKSFAIPFEGQKIVVAGPSPYSGEIAREIYKKGGNVVDVAVAVELALAVTTPYYASLGGGGFALVDMGKGVEALDFRETAPSVAKPDLYQGKPKNASIDGGLAVGVPGIPAGLKALHEKYGKLSWNKLFAPAEKLATKGFLVSGEWANSVHSQSSRFNSAGKKLFPSALLPGDNFVQPQLENVLTKFRDSGTDGFYKGAVANDIVNTVKASGGVIETADLKNYKVRWLKPEKTTYLGYDVYMMPLPSSAGIVMTMALKLADRLKLQKVEPLSVAELHMWAEILRYSFMQRLDLGDQDFAKTKPAPVNYDLLGAQFIEKFDPNHVMKLKSPSTETLHESHTTHFSVLDSEGHSVAMTITLNGNFGSGLVTPKFGIALNNEMDDFNTHPGEPNMYGLIQGEANNVEAGKRPLSSMSPTLIEKKGKVVLSVGSPGGPRIISSVLQVLHRVLANGFDMDQAIQAPRVHHQFRPDILYVDKNRLSPDVIELLKKKGHNVEESSVAKVYGVRVREDGLLEGAFDSRGEGGAGGY